MADGLEYCAYRWQIPIAASVYGICLGVASKRSGSTASRPSDTEALHVRIVATNLLTFGDPPDNSLEKMAMMLRPQDALQVG
jgi:hypothetical protein